LDDIWSFYSNKNFDNKKRNNSKNKDNSFCSSNLRKKLILDNDIKIKDNSILKKKEYNSKSFYSNIINSNDINDKNGNKMDICSISLLNSNRKNGNDINKIKKINNFSSVNKIEKNKYSCSNTNSDILNAWNTAGENENIRDKSPGNSNKGEIKLIYSLNFFFKIENTYKP